MLKELKIETITDVKYKCTICGRYFKEKEDANNCLTGHAKIPDFSITEIYYDQFVNYLPDHVSILDTRNKMLGYYKLISASNNTEINLDGITTKKIS